MTDWTPDLLKSHYDEVLAERDRRYEERFTAQGESTRLAVENADKAGAKAERATERRLEGLNELRGMANDVASRSMPRAEAEAGFGVVNDKIADVATRLTNIEGRGVGAEALGRWLFIVVGALIGIGGIVLGYVN